jgi:hypothetical protein
MVADWGPPLGIATGGLVQGQSWQQVLESR